MRRSTWSLLFFLLSSFLAEEAYAQRMSSATQTVTFAVRRPAFQQSPGTPTALGGTSHAVPAMEPSLAQKKMTATVPIGQTAFRHVDLRDRESEMSNPLSSPSFSGNAPSSAVSVSPDARSSHGNSNCLCSRSLLLTVTD